MKLIELSYHVESLRKHCDLKGYNFPALNAGKSILKTLYKPKNSVFLTHFLSRMSNRYGLAVQASFIWDRTKAIHIFA